MKKFYLVSRVKVWALTVGVGAGLGCRDATSPGPVKPGGSGLVRTVAVERVVVRGMERSITVTGTLAPHESSTLSAKVPGRLQRVEVDLGSAFKAGTLLAQVDPRDYELRVQQAAAALAQARAALGSPREGENTEITVDAVSSVQQAQAVLEEAARNRDRIIRLAADGIASPSEVDTVEATHKVARMRYETAREDARTRLAMLAQRQAEWEIAQKQLSDTSVLAPFDGAVQARVAGVGEYVAAGVPILTVVKVDPLRLRLQVPERNASQVQAGQRVRLTVEGDDRVYEGRLSRLSPGLTQDSRMLLVEAEVPASGSLRPGLFARAQIVLADQERQPSIPLRALNTFAGIEKVVLIREGKAKELDVKTGRRGSNWVEVLAGLTEGEEVVLDPSGLRTGQPLVAGTNAGAVPAERPRGSPPGGATSSGSGTAGAAGSPGTGKR